MKPLSFNTNHFNAKALLLTLFVCLSAFTSTAQSNDGLIAIKLKNASWVPKKCTVISYTPGDSGNGTQLYWLLPSGTKSLSFKEGTKLFLANEKQVDLVVYGKRIDNGKSFLTVKKTDNNQTFKF